MHKQLCSENNSKCLKEESLRLGLKLKLSNELKNIGIRFEKKQNLTTVAKRR
jgi:hypothetical protein